jgi:hypothetical protein
VPQNTASGSYETNLSGMDDEACHLQRVVTANVKLLDPSKQVSTKECERDLRNLNGLGN